MASERPIEEAVEAVQEAGVAYPAYKRIIEIAEKPTREDERRRVREALERKRHDCRVEADRRTEQDDAAGASYHDGAAAAFESAMRLLTPDHVEGEQAEDCEQ